jgi:hypothetical protein
LNVELEDVGSDAIKNIVVFRIIDHTDEKTEKIVYSEPLLAVSRYESIEEMMLFRFFGSRKSPKGA